MLFNTTLFEKNIEKFKKLAERTQQIFNMDQFDFSLHWSESCSLPLNYILPDSIRNKLKAAKKVKVGKNGLIDLLSAEEQEQRIKNLVALFIEQMPLKPDKKSFVLSKLNSLMFRYGSTTSKYPEFKDKFSQVNIIDAPLSKEKYWSKEFVNGKENPSFNQMMHVMGHFLHHCICLEDFRSFSFLSNKCNGYFKPYGEYRLRVPYEQDGDDQGKDGDDDPKFEEDDEQKQGPHAGADETSRQFPDRLPLVPH